MAAADTKDVKTSDTKCKVLHEATIGKAGPDDMLFGNNIVGIYDGTKLMYNRHLTLDIKDPISATYPLSDNCQMGFTIDLDIKILITHIMRNDKSKIFFIKNHIGIIRGVVANSIVPIYNSENPSIGYTLFHKDGKEIKITPNSKVTIDSGDTKISSIAISPKITEQRLVCFVGASDVPETDNFIGIIDDDSEYIAPHMYDLGYTFPIDGKEVPIWYNFGAIYGEVNIYYPPSPDGVKQFRVSYERDIATSNLIGAVIRSSFIPFRETKEDNEYIVIDSIDCVKWYVRYYDLAGSGKLVTQDEAMDYQIERAEVIKSNLPNVLGDLLGYK